MGTIVHLKGSKKKKDSVRWKVHPDIPNPQLVSYPRSSMQDPDVGVRRFPFNHHPVKGEDSKHSRINTMHLLLHLWPGDMKRQLDGMNERITVDNVDQKQQKKPLVSPVSLRKLGKFLGILIVARLEGKKGSSLWIGNKGEGYGSKVDMKDVMQQYQFGQIRKYFEVFFADHLKEGEDAWWQVLGGINAFNKRRKLAVSAGKIKTPDESMSAFRPRTTPTGMYRLDPLLILP